MPKIRVKTDKQVAAFKQTTVGPTVSEKEIKAIRAAGYATTAMKTVYQSMMALEQILVDEFDFKTEDLKKLETRWKDMAIRLERLKRKGLTVLSYKDMAVVGKQAKNFHLDTKAEDAGLIDAAGVEKLKTKLIGK